MTLLYIMTLQRLTIGSLLKTRKFHVPSRNSIKFVTIHGEAGRVIGLIKVLPNLNSLITCNLSYFQLNVTYYVT